MRTDLRRTTPRPNELVHHGLVLLLLSLALWLCLSHLVVPILTAGGVQDAGWLHLTLAAIGTLAAGVAFFRHLRWWLNGQWHSRSGAAFRLLLYCLVVQGVAYLGFFRSFDRASFSTTLTAAAGAFSVLLLLQRSVGAWLSQRRGPKRLVSTFDLAAFYLCVMLVGGEIALRVTASLRPSVLLTRASDAPARSIAASRPAAGRLRMGFPINSSGFYDVDLKPGPHPEPLVIAIGDSFSMGIVPHHYHFTTVAERRLPGVQVYNMGVAAIGPPEYLHLLRTEALGLDPDVIVINLFIGNDLTFSLPPADEAFLRNWYSRDNLLLYQLSLRLPLLLGAGPLEPPGEPAGGSPEPFRNPSPETIEKDFPWVSDPTLEQPTFTPGDFLRIETSHAEARSSLSAAQYQRRFEVLRKIVDAAGEIPVVFLLIPDELQVEDDVWEDVQLHSPRSLARNRGLDLLIKWLKKEGLRYANLLPLLKSQTPLDDGRLHLYRLRDTHFNARGNRVAGEALAELVRPLLPAASMAGSLKIFPVHADGDGDPWISDLQLFNPRASSTATTLKLTLFEGEAVELPTLLQPGALVVIDDLGRRSMLAGAGFVSVQSDSPVVAGLRTYQRRSTGTFGDFVTPLELTEDRVFFTGLTPAARSVDLMIVQPSAGASSGGIGGKSTVLSSDFPGAFPTITAPQTRFRLTDLQGVSSGSLAGSTPLAALATVIDQGSDDLAIYPGLPLEQDGVLVGLAHADGSLAHAKGHGGRTVRSNLSVYAPDGGELSLVFAAYRADQTERPHLQYTLAAGETLVLEDVVALVGLRDTEGVLWYQASRPVLAVAHTSRTGDPGPSGQTVLSSPVVRPGSEAYFLFASRTGTSRAGFRSDLALANPGPSEVRLDVRLANATATAVKPRTVAVAARCAILLEGVVGWLGRDQLSDGVIAVRGDGPFAGALALIDLRSGDVTTVQPANPGLHEP